MYEKNEEKCLLKRMFSKSFAKTALFTSLFLVMMLINLASAMAYYQSHNISEIRNVDSNLVMGSYDIAVDVLNITGLGSGCNLDTTTSGRVTCGSDATDDTVSGSELDGVFSTTGILRRIGASTYSTITDSSANWDTAYTHSTTDADTSASNELQNLWATIQSQSGSTAANTQTDTLTINGAGIASTSISGDTLTITATEVDPQVGSVTSSNWCVGDGSAVQCSQPTPDTSTTNEIQNVMASGGLQRDGSNNFGIIDCSTGQVIKDTGTNTWGCADDAGLTGSGSATQVAYWASASSLTGSSNLYWDGVNNRLGIETSGAPMAKLDVYGLQNTPAIPNVGTASNGILRIRSQLGDALDIGINTSGNYVRWLQAGYGGSSTYAISLNPLGGNVGVGTAGPLSKLSVGGAGSANYAIFGTGASIGVTGDGTSYGVAGNGANAGVYGNSSSYGLYGNSAAGTGVYGTGATGGNFVTSSNDGTNYALISDGIFRIENFAHSDDDYGRIGFDSSDRLFFDPDVTGAALMYLHRANDAVGIGTSGPLSKLSVGGTGNANYAIYGTGTAYGVYGSGTSYGVYGLGSTYGVYSSGDLGIGTGSDIITAGNPLNIEIAGTGTAGALYIGSSSTGGDDLFIRDGYLGVASNDYSNSMTYAGTDGDAYIEGTLEADDKIYFIDVYSTTTTSPANVFVTSTGNLVRYTTSSIRYKENISDIDLGLDAAMKLRPVSFKYKEGYVDDMSPQVGFIAEEVETVSPRLVVYEDYQDEDNVTKTRVENVRYDKIPVVLTKAIQEQQSQIEQLKSIVCLDHPDAEVCKG